MDDGLIRCARCGTRKSPDAFNWRRKAIEQRDTYCRPCRADYHHEHYVANRQRYIAQSAARKQKLAEDRLAYLIEWFGSHPCVDCGERDPIVLEFDHQGDKLFSIGSQIRERTWEAILNEIAKCEVVCANCHRRRTARQRNSVRAALVRAAAGEDHG